MRDDIEKVSCNTDVDDKVDIYEVGVNLSKKLFANNCADEPVAVLATRLWTRL